MTAAGIGVPVLVAALVSWRARPISAEPSDVVELYAFEADHANLGLAIPYRLIVHNGEPDQIDERTYLLPLWCLT